MHDAPSLLALNGLLFVAVLSVFLLLIYKVVSTGKFRNCIWDAAMFAVLTVFISYIAGATLGYRINYVPQVPEWAVVLISIAAFCYSAAGFFVQRRRNKNRLSPYSVKEALDNLNSGICFADDTGRIVLINYDMGALISSVIGSFPQTLAEIEDALTDCESLGSGLYRFPDGSVHQVSTAQLDGFTQTAAQDVTALYAESEQLALENEKLRATNEEIQAMLERLADRIREQETLGLKVQIHDDIGTSLIAITNMMNGRADGAIDSQLSLLKNAVNYFSATPLPRSETPESVRESAESMGVALNIIGTVPNGDAARLIALAARECVTNCINHAGGDIVNVEIEENGSFITATFTNNGEKPRGKITEGGGLSSLRKSVENAGGKMTIHATPAFRLTLELRYHND